MRTSRISLDIGGGISACGQDAVACACVTKAVGASSLALVAIAVGGDVVEDAAGRRQASGDAGVSSLAIGIATFASRLLRFCKSVERRLH